MEKRNKRKGFTMVELMAVLIILGLLATLLLRNFMGQTDKARSVLTQVNLKELHSAVSQFKMDTGRYPQEEEGLRVLIEQPTDVSNWQTGGYLESTEIPQDGWNNDFIYELNPESGKAFVIISCGPDGERGTDDDMFSTDAN